MHVDLKKFAESLAEQTGSFSPAEQAWITNYMGRQLLLAMPVMIESRRVVEIRAMSGDPRTEADIEREAVAGTRWPNDERWLALAGLYRSYQPRNTVSSQRAASSARSRRSR